MDQTYKYARDFFTALADPAPLDDIFDALHRYIKSIGYPTIYFGIREDPTHPAPASMENRLIYARDDDGWWSEYSDNRYYLDDPYYELGRQIRGNFLFTPPDSLTERQRRFLEYATKRKKMNGFAFSDQMISGRVWGCSASGGEKKPNEPQIIEIKSAFYAWNRHFNSQLSGAFAKQHGLSELDLSRVHLLMCGYSARSIAEIQSASEHAINHSFLRIRKKLSVDSNAQLAVRMIQLGLFDS